ncbi:bifunctional diguanylate cyclase/phosphodiesterase [Clostridium oryzae]|uniref:bifunctional diguanylate cyclase/phosphodiesterase n=1 Tax=Clostridium oryzae TaxID=1450648 RepID=UPI001472B4A3|nr:GGDEF domain-containing phosphodiesterase [Clostridium oryzae]
MKLYRRAKSFFLKFMIKSESIDYYTNTKDKINPFLETIKITVIYGMLAMLWIFISDEVLSRVVKDVHTYKLISMYKGWFYIVISMLFLYDVMFRRIHLFKLALDKIFMNVQQLNKSNKDLIMLEKKLKKQFCEIEQQRDALIERDTRYKLAVEGAECGIWDWDIINGIMYFSPKWKSYLGFEDSEVDNTFEAWQDLLCPEDREEAISALEKYLTSKDGVYENVYRMVCKNGEYKFILSKGNAIRDKNGRAIRIAGSHTDITQQKRIEDKLNSFAYYDMLTGLPNSFLFEEKADNLIRNNTPFALLYIDIDNFKDVNDTVGHSSANILLKSISESLKEAVAMEDCTEFVYRFSGDEFGVIIQNVKDEKQIVSKINCIFKAIRKSWIIENQEYFISCSIGGAIYPCHGNSVSLLLQNSGAAMYYVKKKSKDGYCFYSNKIYEQNIKQMKMITDLKRAIENQEFMLYYQPIISISSGKLTGVEALIRWNHPEKGIISPMEFIPLAEERGLIYDIEKWALRTAVMQKKYWEQQGHQNIKMSVNLSGKRVSNSELIKEVQQLVADTSVKCDEIQLEVTETAVMEDIDASMEILKEIKKFGIKIALDDFGTGYSSLTYLKKLPIDVVKLDRNFIKNISKIGENEFIVEHIIKLTHELKLKIVAEGIETKEQLIFLKQNSCDYGQGYLFSRPVTKEEIEQLLLIN